MRRPVLFFLFLVFCFSLPAQILTPVKWKTSVSQVSAQEYDLIFTATMDEGWNIYSQHTSDEGPVPTTFYFEDSEAYTRVGEVAEKGKKKEGPDPLFGGVTVIKYTHGPVVFTQRIKVSDPTKAIAGYVEYMTCDDERCLPPTEEEFSIDLTTAIPGEKEKVKGDKSTGALTPTKSADEGEVVVLEGNAQTLETEQEQPEPLFDNAASEDEAITIGENILEPVDWELEVKKLAEDQYELIFTALLDEGWNIYSQHLDDDGPIPTEFVFEEGDHYRLDGEALEEGKKTEGEDPFFAGAYVIKYIASPVVFRQKVNVIDESRPLTGYLIFMTCDDKQCLPPAEVPFRVNFAEGSALIGLDAEVMVDATGSDTDLAEAGMLFGGISRESLEAPVGSCGNLDTTVADKSYWSIFILGFLGGLIALLTPCVFPMIPLTVSFFTKGNKNRRKGMIDAFLYGFFIFLVYLLLSVPFHLMDSINPDILNDISTNIWLNLAFFAIFLFFAFSFFGYYELTLPSSWTNRVSSAEGIGGALGIFFMALTLALVSFSCTGPILGSLLAGALSSDGGALQLTMGMSGFGLALALPFGLFAAFPSWMNNLPKSGGWLNTVKVFLGFIELALALKFLSNADLVKHWGILKIEPFLALWMLVFLGMGLYLFGIIKFPHDSPIKKLSIARMLTGAAAFAFVIYLATGFIYDEKAGSYRSLTLLSGLAPPAHYSWFNPADCPQNLNCFKDFEEGLAYAKKVNKPIMLDFTGHACVNCRKMEEQVWPDRKVYDIINENYVLISLYVDEKLELPEAEQKVVPKVGGGTRKLRTTGNKWSYFQAEFFQANSQPFYVLLSPDGSKKLTAPVGYTPDEEAYAKFLNCGLENFNELSRLEKEKEVKEGVLGVR